MQPDIVKCKYSSGVFFVKDQEWKVGERYELLHLLGSGSFSSVCCAVDKHSGLKVALKRIPDVLSSPELARRVLREICILRRLRHPFIITLVDAFLMPSSTGQYKLVNGELLPSSLDCYLAMELGEDGDLFNLRGQISAEEVRLLMWQLLHALKYLHTINVWHRDVKSSNVLLARNPGHRLAKLADFGSSRSATQGGYHWAEQGAPEPRSGGLRMPISRQVIQEQQAQHKRGEAPGQATGMDISADGSDQVQFSDLIVQLGQEEQRKGGGVGFCSPLTRVVATPCYRAPEVVMSRGGYTSAIDMWSLGCIFGELLQRTPRVGSASTPHLKIAPLFAIHAGILKTPQVGERWSARDAPGDVTTRGELQALFDVIGTPSWVEAEDVRALEWRHYLQRLPGRAPTLFRRFAFAGEVAVHLLSRLLAFDPERRCTAEEALQHEYFVGLETGEPDMTPAGATEEVATCLSGDMEDVTLAAGERDVPGLKSEEEPDIRGLKSQVDAAWEYQAAKKSRLESPQQAESGPPESSGHGQRLHEYSTPQDAAHALALLESEMVGSGSRSEQIGRLRFLLEKECEAQAKEGLTTGLPLERMGPGERQRWRSPRRVSPLAVWADPMRKAASVGTEGLLVDESQAPDAAKFGQERLSNTADTWSAKLDTAAHLKPGRHGEWTANSGTGPAAGPRWGVSMTPPGTRGLDPKVQQVIRSQQLR